MRLQWSHGTPGSLWLAPMLLGVLLILMGVVLYVWPKLLAYFVAGIFIVVGCGLLGSGWRMRRRVSYRPIDRLWQVHDPPDDVSGA